MKEIETVKMLTEYLMNICISFEWGRLFKITTEETTKEKKKYVWENK